MMEGQVFEIEIKVVLRPGKWMQLYIAPG